MEWLLEAFGNNISILITKNFFLEMFGKITEKKYNLGVNPRLLDAFEKELSTLYQRNEFSST